jgi:hypothetical protein
MKTFTIEMDESNNLRLMNNGFADHELVGLMELIQADLRVRFAFNCGTARNEDIRVPIRTTINILKEPINEQINNNKSI